MPRNVSRILGRFSPMSRSDVTKGEALARIIHERARRAHWITGFLPARDAMRPRVRFRSRCWGRSASRPAIEHTCFVAERIALLASAGRTRYERRYPARAPRPSAIWLQAFRNGNDAGKCTTTLRAETTT